MISAFLEAVSTNYEGEDIEINYSIYDNDELVSKKTLLKDYKKPAIVGQFALIILLKELASYEKEGSEIKIFINDPALNELVRGTSGTKNKDVLKMARKVKEALDKFENPIIIKDVSIDSVEIAKWNAALHNKGI
ncbi:hypothetical protein RH915_10930 [Serpentinicella sp. ANB-PHB4]|uniref:hypothetical protein n=1 Tax=Serpentinicella sp. ANB-PHB4 TaxID=3074076 RepID=UPI00285920F0|nr:hypothetical protein [Serpentinicella sp. ANB-PHB4]MDR5660003.1 hypothetical protein [Serpentinicella sp. ANB-PHB4]